MQDSNSKNDVSRAFDVEAFYESLDLIRENRRLTWKDVASQAHVSASTLSRMAQGRRPDVDGLACLLAWSGLNASTFIPRARVSSADSMAEISGLLKADPNLSPESANALEAIVKIAYEKFKDQ